LTIAHRLATIMDYDKVMTMSFGKLEEFDSPANLLRKGTEHSLLAALVAESGPQTAELLQRLAFDAEAAAQGRISSSVLQSHMQLALSNRSLHESSVSRRRPHSHAPVPTAGDYAEAADAAAVLPPSEDALDEQSLVRFHEAHGGGAFDDEEEEAQMAQEMAAARNEDEAERRDLLLSPSPLASAHLHPEDEGEQVRVEVRR